IVAQQQRPHAVSPVRGQRESADNQLLLPVALDRQSIPAPPRRVFPLRELGDDSLRAQVARLCKNLVALSLNVLAQPDRLRMAAASEQSLQNLFALHQRQPAQIVTVQVQQVECEISQLR